MDHLGPPGGFSQEYHGYTIYDNKLWMAINSGTNTDFFGVNVTQNINNANQRWINWFGSLTEGIINFLCYTTEDEIPMHYCYDNGQPYAPAKDPSKEIYSILNYDDLPPFIQQLKGV